MSWANRFAYKRVGCGDGKWQRLLGDNKGVVVVVAGAREGHVGED